MPIHLEPLNQKDAGPLLQFELENRAYFEQSVPSRGNSFYHSDTFRSRLETRLREQAMGQALYYLIKDSTGTILGRINVTDIEEGRGHLGYRIGESHTGKGVAKDALKLLIGNLKEKHITELHAKTTKDNTASRKVLEKNGFREVETNKETVELNGQKLTFVCYTRILEGGAE
ncbi:MULTISPECIES: GNAT family N-acetyltransferase [Alteribacter]|uniref:N-acetyltransferase n=1 Tax=Alteribacter keqinensis TaxID=2483800 RepID=A0A3M7TNN9_9BACI|nr:MULTISPECIES: GNAT family N-acetyltransferase [Alteribacter]MBM7095265.1 GNAT family N-acetyltransferase [Alteribacter salitolerans]RNA67008.1 N-acetyltransferase [Alteribacter keqinensis]